MNHNPLQNLIDIDQAIRHRAPGSTPGRTGGLAELIRRDPEIEVWLSWLCEASQQRTCGALEELARDRELMPPQPLSADTSNDCGVGTGGGLSLILIGPKGDPITPSAASIQHLSFAIVTPGNYQLFTVDRTLLWSQAMASTNQTRPPDVWRLAAAPVEDPVPSEGTEEASDSDPPALNTPHPCIQRWPLAPWSLMLELNRLGSRTWLDVTQE